jgi:hypothetical protein
VPVGVAEEAAHLPLGLDRRGEELGPAAAQGLVRDWRSGTRIVIAWATARGSAGGAKVTSGLSAVGPPPVTSSSQVPKARSTTEVPPYSRYSSAPRTSR